MTRFHDAEIEESLHRWNWLLRGDDGGPALLSLEQGLGLMRSWITATRVDESFGRDPYSTGERIVNGSLFVLLKGGEGLPDDLMTAFQMMVRQVAEGLEYHHPELTGNHAFNNARALLFGGLLTHQPEAVDLALAIARERLSTVVTADGFLREGSSHYHLLFTRWVLEMLWLAKRHDRVDFVTLLTPFATSLVRRCWFFLVYSERDESWSIPLIGDVSPDCPPGWLVTLPWSTLACEVFQPDGLPPPPRHRGWSDLFGSVPGTSPQPPGLSGVFPESGWVRVDHRSWTLVLRAESTNGALRAGHAHLDLGSFVLFHRGVVAITDAGRLDYTMEGLGPYGRSASAHNTLWIDGLGVSADGPTWLADQYRAVRVSLDVSDRGGEMQVVLQHDGFSRLAGRRVQHQRQLRFHGGGVQVTDRLDGMGDRHVRVRWHFSPGTTLCQDAHEGWCIPEMGLRFTPAALSNVVVQRGTERPPHGGWHFPAYGTQQTSTTLDVAGVVQLPAVLTHSLAEES